MELGGCLERLVWLLFPFVSSPVWVVRDPSDKIHVWHGIEESAICGRQQQYGVVQQMVLALGEASTRPTICVYNSQLPRPKYVCQLPAFSTRFSSSTGVLFINRNLNNESRDNI